MAERRVVMEPGEEGTAHLYGLDLPPDRVRAVMDRIDRPARRLRVGTETRTMDQPRADVYLDLLEGRSRGGGGRSSSGSTWPPWPSTRASRPGTGR